MGQPTPHDHVAAFFAEFDPNFKDEAVLSYVADSLVHADPSDLDQALLDLLDLCASAAPEFDSIAEEERLPKLFALYHAVSTSMACKACHVLAAACEACMAAGTTLAQQYEECPAF